MAETDTLHYRIKQAAVQAITGLSLQSDDENLIVRDVKSLLWPDTSNLTYPAVVVTHITGTERDNSGTTEHKWMIYPLLIMILDAETARFHAREATYLNWRKQIWDLFNDRRAAFRNPIADPEVGEVYWAKATSGQIVDPRWQALQIIASHLNVDVYTSEARLAPGT
jgi:hypothetical protein